MDYKAERDGSRIAAAHLNEAAKAIDRALLLLNTAFTPCHGGCGKNLSENVDHWEAYDRFVQWPRKLRETAAKLVASADAPVRSRGYEAARRWYLEHGPEGPSLVDEAVSLVRSMREALDAPHTTPLSLMDEADTFLKTTTGQAGQTTAAVGREKESRNR
jgi:hypothetical protein